MLPPALQRNLQPLIAAVLMPCVMLTGGVFAAGNDNTIEADGIWHDNFDVHPAHPQRNQAFALELRAFRFDLTGATVALHDGSTHWFVPMAWDRQDETGTFDIWRAEIGPVDADSVYYHIQLHDGSAYAASGFWGGNPPGGDFWNRGQALISD